MDMKVALRITAGVTGQQAVDQLRGSMEKLDGVVSSARNALLALATAGSFVAIVKGAIDAGDKLNDLSQRTGLAVEDLDALSFAAQQNGTTLDAVSGALGKLAKNMADAAGGGKEAAATFAQFGISQKELANGSITSTEAMARIADKIAGMPDGWQKAAAAQRVFGKSAAEIVPLLNAGGDAIRNARSELESYGALFTGGFAKAADEFNDNLAVLQRMMGGLGLSIASDLLPSMTAFTEGLIESRKQSSVLGSDTSLQDWTKTAALGLAALVDVLRVIPQMISAVVGSFEAVYADLKLLGTFLAGGEGLNPFSAKNRDTLSKALDERNRTVADSNKRYVDLWTMNGSQTFDAVKAALDKVRILNSSSAKNRGGNAGFDFGGAEKADEFDKLKKQLEEQLAKTGDLTKAEEVLKLLQTQRYSFIGPAQRAELLRLAAKIDATKEMAETEKEIAAYSEAESNKRTQRLISEYDSAVAYKLQQEQSLALLQIEGQAAGMTAREYERRVAALKDQQETERATAGMLPETAAYYRKIADAAFAARQGVEQLNYEQSRTFEAGAKKAFDSYLEDINNVAKSTEQLFTNAFKGMEDALVDFAMTGKLNFKDLASSIIKDMIRMTIQMMIMKPLMGAFGGLFGGGMTAQTSALTGGTGIASGVSYTAANGMAFTPGARAFAYGGVVNSPTPFMFANGGAMNNGIMGEAGPEAIMPLRRTNSGKLGVVASGLGGGEINNVTVNVSVESGSTDQTATATGAAQLGKAIASAVRVELMNQKRPGGLLAA